MPTSYSSNYQLKLIGTGLEAGTWGTSTNANWEKIEAAIGGSATITIDNPPTGSTYVGNVLSLVTNPLVDPGALDDRLNPGAADPVLRELLSRRGQELGSAVTHVVSIY